jgi:hypothetical protein
VTGTGFVRPSRLTAQQAVALLRTFYAAYGPEQMDASYGWKHVPEQLVPGERFYRFMDQVTVPENEGPPDVCVVGWGSLVMNTRDATDDSAACSAGVFPLFQRRGYHRKIMDWLCEKSAGLGAVRATRIVYKVNEAHYKRTKKVCEDPASGWVYAGDIWFPAPGYGYFVKPFEGAK